MAMKETVKSLKAYFGLSGAGTAFLAVKAFSEGDVVFGAIGAAFAVAYIYVAVRLPKLLAESTTIIYGILAGACVLLGLGVLAGAIQPDAQRITKNLLGLLINWYLYSNVRRLAAETRSPAVTETSK